MNPRPASFRDGKMTTMARLYKRYSTCSDGMALACFVVAMIVTLIVMVFAV